MIKINTKELNRKNKLITNATKVLKSEFVGIDKQIDEIMRNIRTWYLFPSFHSRPTIINMWGLSGVGKTSLVRRIVELLGIEGDMAYFNFASIYESNSYQIEEIIEDEIKKDKNNIVFVYDEFQYANTINPINHAEIDKKTGLKPFWELLDTGILHRRINYYHIFRVKEVEMIAREMAKKLSPVIENGLWVNFWDTYEFLDDFQKRQVDNNRTQIGLKLPPCPDETKRKPIQTPTPSYDNPVLESNCNCKNTSGDSQEIENYIEDSHICRWALSMFPEKFTYKTDFLRFVETINSYTEYITFLSQLSSKLNKGIDMDFSNSIMFVIGNLDEAYELSFNVNPDMSPDQFRKITEEISVVEIKEALKDRFRNEQIARLGNTHVIYPSFSSQNFKDIIELSLADYAKIVKKTTRLNITFDESIKKIIYDEGVYPTHGTRPLFSTIQEVVKTQLPMAIETICQLGIKNKVDTLVYFFSNETEKIGITFLDKDDNNCGSYESEVKLRLKKFRDNTKDEQQAICALHESGHFVMYAKMFGKMPEKLASRTASTNASGFLMEDFDNTKKKISKADMEKELCVDLGGYVAEKMFFGEEMTGGAQSDLKKATMLACKMGRTLGLTKGNPYVSTFQIGAGHPEDYGASMIFPETTKDILEKNADIKKIIDNCILKIEDTFRDDDWVNMLKKSSLYLCDNPQMPKEKMEELYNEIPEHKRCVERKEDFYRKIIENIK